MASYDKLPSGRWRGRVMIDGVTYSVTAETRRECVKLLERRTQIKRGEMTVGEAVAEYIASRESVFSPSTVKGYLTTARTCFTDLQRRELSDLDEQLVARAVNDEAKIHSPKTVRNAWGLIRASIAPYVPVERWRIHLPQKTKKEPYVPAEEEVAALIAAVSGTEYEIPFKLAAYCGLRRSEICALTYNDIKDGYVTVNKALVSDAGGGFSLKNPKTYAGYRKIKLPQNVKIKGEGSTPITALTPHALSQKCRRLSGGRFSIHDLRHFYASVLLRLGVPNKYAAKQMGHSGEEMLKRVYQHLFPDAEAEYDSLISDRLGKL